MVQVNVHEAKSQLSRLIEATLAGERVVIARAGKPVVDLVIHRGSEVVFGVDGWRGFESDPAVLEGTDAQVAEMFYGPADS